MRFPSNKTLGTICVYGAIASISGVMLMKYKLEDRIRNAEYYRLAVQTLRQHKGATSLLGQPIKELGFNLGDADKNHCDGKTAEFEVNVKGPNDKGKLFFWATRTEDRGWILDKLELEVKSQPEKRFLLIKQNYGEEINEEKKVTNNNESISFSQ